MTLEQTALLVLEAGDLRRISDDTWSDCAASPSRASHETILTLERSGLIVVASMGCEARITKAGRKAARRLRHRGPQ